jgi:anion-transporting  ArsA/GET3 family ATPase
VVPLQSFTASRLAIVAGKGGVGKTTVTAALARAAAEQGLRVLVIDVDGRPGLVDLLCDHALDTSERTLGYEDRLLVDGLGPSGSGCVSGRSIEASTALVEYLDTHGMRRVSKRLVSSGVVDVVSTAAPGIDDLLVLGKIKSIERSDSYDFIVVDGPAAGHAITFLMAASGLYDAIGSGPIHTQADEVLGLLRNPERCQVILVTIPEETPVNETIETAFALEDRVGVQLGPVVVNAFDTDGLAVPDPNTVDLGAEPDARALADAAQFRRRRAADQVAQVERLAASLPLPQVHLPAVFAAGLTAHDVQSLAQALVDGNER